jgi:hypothetical protein
MSELHDRPEGSAPWARRAPEQGSQVRAAFERARETHQRAIRLRERTAMRYLQLGDQPAADLELQRADRQWQLLPAATARLARIAQPT